MREEDDGAVLGQVRRLAGAKYSDPSRVRCMPDEDERSVAKPVEPGPLHPIAVCGAVKTRGVEEEDLGSRVVLPNSSLSAIQVGRHHHRKSYFHPKEDPAVAGGEIVELLCQPMR